LLQMYGKIPTQPAWFTSAGQRGQNKTDERGRTRRQTRGADADAAIPAAPLIKVLHLSARWGVAWVLDHGVEAQLLRLLRRLKVSDV